MPKAKKAQGAQVPGEGRLMSLLERVDEVLEIVDRRDHYHLGAHEVDYQTSDGEWHYDGWYFKRANEDEQADRTD